MLGTYHRLRVRVSASDRTVIRAARLKLTPTARRSNAHREARKAFLRQMLDYHHGAQRIVREGRF